MNECNPSTDVSAARAILLASACNRALNWLNILPNVLERLKIQTSESISEHCWFVYSKAAPLLAFFACSSVFGAGFSWQVFPPSKCPPTRRMTNTPRIGRNRRTCLPYPLHTKCIDLSPIDHENNNFNANKYFIWNVFGLIRPKLHKELLEHA